MHPAHPGDDVVHLRLVGRVDRQQALDLGPAGLVARVRRVVAELRVLDQVPDDVDAEAVDAAPSQKRSTSCIASRTCGLRQLRSGCSLQEGVVVVLAGRLVEGPGRPAEIAEPVVRRRAVGLGDRARCTSRASGSVRDERLSRNQGCWSEVWFGTKSRMTFSPLAVRLGDQAVEVGERAEERVDVAVVGDVVAEIGHRRGIDRRDPDGVDAEPDEIVEPLADAGEVADAVAVACPGRSADRSGR